MVIQPQSQTSPRISFPRASCTTWDYLGSRAQLLEWIEELKISASWSFKNDPESQMTSVYICLFHGSYHPTSPRGGPLYPPGVTFAA